MSIHYVTGDLFLSRVQTLAHGVNCRGRMGAGIAREFRRRFPEMFNEYRRLCHNGRLRPGEVHLWKDEPKWVLNLATQDVIEQAQLSFVRGALIRVAENYNSMGITSVAVPRIASGLGGIEWAIVREEIEELWGSLPIPIFVYEVYREGITADERWETPAGASMAATAPVFFWKDRYRQWKSLSNFAIATIVVDGKEYRSVEHYFQACKSTTEWEHEMVRNAGSPAEARSLGKTVGLRPDWEDVKEDVMMAGLLAKFRQHPQLRQLLLSTGDRPVHEDSPNDMEWGWGQGRGQDRLGKLLVRVRAIIRDEHGNESQP